ncbi:MAG: hypothetical protein OXI36_09390 [Gammaproteobacteria bacterium]|nr:hypothetical protein [Gammaproteobacteria bacterium]MDE0403623.1 hypothetical protein [Gammaproteobacteria bacterium]
MIESLSRIKHIAFSEIRTFRRLTRFWIAMVLLALCCFVGYFFAVCGYMFLAPFSPSFGASSPFYLLSYIDPTYFLFFQIVTLFLLYDSRQRLSRAHIGEALDSKPPTTFEYLTGRVLGVSFLVWTAAATIVMFLYLAGVFSVISGLDFSEVFQIHSLINLLVIDVPVMLIFWSAWTIFLATVLRYRVLVLVIGLGTMLAWFYFSNQLPFSLHSLVAASSNDTLFVSDLLPQFASGTTLAVRLATLLLAIGLIFWAGFSSGRSEAQKKSMDISLASSCLALSGVVFAIALLTTLSTNSHFSDWKVAHEKIETEQKIDLLKIAGDLEIKPGRELTSELVYSFEVVDSPVADTLIFSLNPGMKVSKAVVNGQTPEFTFQDGILTLQLSNTLGLNETHELQLTIRGKPNPRFANIDQSYDYVNDRLIPPDTVKLFGTQGLIFDSRFVALMPGAYWYPIPGPIKELDNPLSQSRDFFDVDVNITLSTTDWGLVATGNTEETSTGVFEIQTSNPVSEIGLFATKFESVSIEIEGMKFAIFTHAKHDQNLSLFDTLEGARLEALQDQIKSAIESGLRLPNQSLTFVEVPRQLRTVGGGWRMHSAQSLPGVILLREHGFPRANLRKNLFRTDNELTDAEQLQTKILAIREFFERSISTDSLRDNLVLQSWNFQTSAAGEHAVVLDSVISNLIGLVTTQHWLNGESVFYSFSIHSTANIAPQLRIHGKSSTWSLAERIEGDRYSWATDEIQANERNYVNAISSSVIYDQIALADIPTRYGAKSDLEHLLYKSRKVATAIYELNNRDALVKWLLALQDNFRGRTYTLEELTTHAVDHEISIEPFVTEWIHSGQPPGFVASNATVSRILDDEHGQPRYQASVDIRNTEPTAGVVALSGSIWGGTFGRRNRTIIPGLTSATLSFVTNEELEQLWLHPYYSLNRMPVPIRTQHQIDEIVDVEPRPDFVLSEWQPSPTDGITIDNLDSGFRVLNQQIDTRSLRPFGPIQWFRDAFVGNVGYYQNMKIVDPMLGVYRYTRNQWYLFRVVWSGAHPYGRHEPSFAEARANRTNGVARFSADIPENGTWELEYYWPWPEDDDDHGDVRLDRSYKLIVESEQLNSEHELKVNELDLGWNRVGSFELDTGVVNVDLTGEVVWSNGQRLKWGSVIADAIRWVQVLDE